MSSNTLADCTRGAVFADIMSVGSNVSAPARGCCSIPTLTNVNVSSCLIPCLKSKPHAQGAAILIIEGVELRGSQFRAGITGLMRPLGRIYNAAPPAFDLRRSRPVLRNGQDCGAGTQSAAPGSADTALRR